jgi:acetolactate synthase-1/2/3 large subunit
VENTAFRVEYKPRTGSEAMCEALLDEGVEYLFGYPGGAIMPFYDALPDYPLRHILVRHEQAAAHAADGYARAAGSGCAWRRAVPGRRTW